MAERLDALTVREYTDRDGNKKSSWTKIGAAFPTRDGGYSITLDALPVTTMGERGPETRIILRAPLPKDDHQPNNRRDDRRDDRGGYDHDDPRTGGYGR